MEKIITEGKSFEEAYEKILNNNLTEKDFVYKKEEVKGKLFKGDIIKLEAYLKKDIYDFVKSYLKEVIGGLGLEVSFEVKTREDRTTIKLFSDNNPILIGKNGQTIKALEVLVRQRILIETGVNFKVTLDVENYKDKREARLIKLAKQTAKEVLKSKIAVELENMNSFERRIVHNALTEFKDITTFSSGEEPHRHIVIDIKK